jgi:YD repeat-containing protein
LREALRILRNAFPNAQVTTFTYDPLIGVTSITDPRGETVYYHYDDFNRLEFVKDAQGDILSKNAYNYKR